MKDTCATTRRGYSSGSHHRCSVASHMFALLRGGGAGGQGLQLGAQLWVHDHTGYLGH